MNLPEPSTVTDFLYVLRNEAGKAAEGLSAQVQLMREELWEAEKVLSRLDRIADKAEKAAELVHEAGIDHTEEPTEHEEAERA
jgi:hypothetical protein